MALGSAEECLVLIISEGFPNPNNSMILCCFPRMLLPPTFPCGFYRGGPPQEPGLSLSLLTPPGRCCELRGRGQIQQHRF